VKCYSTSTAVRALHARLPGQRTGAPGRTAPAVRVAALLRDPRQAPSLIPGDPAVDRRHLRASAQGRHIGQIEQVHGRNEVSKWRRKLYVRYRNRRFGSSVDKLVANCRQGSSVPDAPLSLAKKPLNNLFYDIHWCQTVTVCMRCRCRRSAPVRSCVPCTPLVVHGLVWGDGCAYHNFDSTLVSVRSAPIARCNDRTCSFSQHRHCNCSRHGASRAGCNRGRRVATAELIEQAQPRTTGTEGPRRRWQMRRSFRVYVYVRSDDRRTEELITNVTGSGTPELLSLVRMGGRAVRRAQMTRSQIAPRRARGLK
jgi:hypothetical protein